MAGTTPALEKVRQIADAALNEPEGLRIKFTVADYGSLRAAFEAARSFQQAFSAMRSRERRKAMTQHQKKYEGIDTDFKGPYDFLACNKRVMPDGAGYLMLLRPGAVIDFATNVESIATGKPLKEFSEEFARSNAILQFWIRKGDEATHMRVKFENPLSPDQERYFWKHQPRMAKMLYDGGGFPYPPYADVPADQWETVKPEAPPAPVSSDPNDIPLDANPFTYGKETP